MSSQGKPCLQKGSSREVDKRNHNLGTKTFQGTRAWLGKPELMNCWIFSVDNAECSKLQETVIWVYYFCQFYLQGLNQNPTVSIKEKHPSCFWPGKQKGLSWIKPEHSVLSRVCPQKTFLYQSLTYWVSSESAYLREGKYPTPSPGTTLSHLGKGAKKPVWCLQSGLGKAGIWSYWENVFLPLHLNTVSLKAYFLQFLPPSASSLPINRKL